MTREKLIGQHKLVYETAPRDWQDGFPIGNGHFGAMVYQPQGIELAINKLDIWDRRAEYPPKVPFKRIMELIEGCDESFYPWTTGPHTETEKRIHKNLQQLRKELATENPKPNAKLPSPKLCGKLTIEIDDWFMPPLHTIFRQEQELSLYDATASGEYEIAAKASRFESFVHPDINLIVVKMEDTWTDDRLMYLYEQVIRLSREYEPGLGKMKTGFENGISFIQYKFTDGFEYVMAMLIDGVETSKPEISPAEVRLTAKLDYAKKRKYHYTVYVSAATSLDNRNPLGEVKKILKNAAKQGFSRLKKQHDNWWLKFWQKSGIELDNKFLEGLWYFSLYEFASSSRGDLIPGLFGLWATCRSVPWLGDYHGDMNEEMTYWHIFSSNHIELGEPMFKTLERLAKIARKQTKELYGIDGLKFQIATLDTGAELTVDFYRMMICSTAFYGLLFWDWYTHTLDKNALKEHIFPILEDGSKFYVAMTKEKNGTLLIGPSWAPEQGPLPAYNCNNDLGLLKPFWKAYVTACNILGKKSELLDKVQYYLESFPDYPQKDGEFIDSLTAGGFIRLNHPGLLAMAVPGNDVDGDSPLVNVARKTLHNYLDRTNRKSFSDRKSSACDMTWTWLFCHAIKLFDTEYAEHILMDTGIGEYLKTNGMFAYYGGDYFRSIEEKRKAYMRDDDPAIHALFTMSSTKRGKQLAMSMLQQASAFIYAMNQMLMQSQGGIIRIFPAVMKCVGDCAFDSLRAEGAFLVSGRQKENRTEQVSVKSLAGSICKLRIYDIIDSATLKITDSKGNAIEAVRIEKNTWQFPTKKGETYFWSRNGKPEKIELLAGNISGVKEIRDSRGNVITYGRKGHLYEE